MLMAPIIGRYYKHLAAPIDCDEYSKWALRCRGERGTIHKSFDRGESQRRSCTLLLILRSLDVADVADVYLPTSSQLVPTHQLQLRATEEVAQILRAQAERKAEEPVEDAPRTILTYIRVNSKAKSTDDRHFVPRSDNPPRGTAPTRTTSLPLALYSRNAVYSRSPGLPLLVPLSPLPGD